MHPSKNNVKSAERRAAILEQITDHIVANGLSTASLRPLAKAASISDRMLLYYFADKAEIMTAVLQVVAHRITVLLAQHIGSIPQPIAVLRPRLIAVVLADEMWPYMRLWLEIAALSAQGDAFYRDVGEQIARGFLAWGLMQLESENPEQRSIDAAQLLVMIEGAALLKGVGLEDVCAQAW